jgi:integrase
VPPDVFPIHPDSLSHAFRSLVIASGSPPIRWHDLRHGAASLMLGAGVPVHMVSHRLGHSLASATLNAYAHVMDGQGAAAAEALAALVAVDAGSPTG